VKNQGNERRKVGGCTVKAKSGVQSDNTLLGKLM
jgi:hypothetical protein